MRACACAGKEDLEAASVIPSILQAVQVRLHSPITSARKRAMLLAQVFAFVVDPGNPLQFEDFHSDDEVEADAGKVADVFYGPVLPGDAAGEGGGGQGGEGQSSSTAAGGVAEARAGCKGAASLVGAQAAVKKSTRRKKELAVKDPDELMVSSESDSESDGSEQEDGEEEDSADEDQGAGGAAVGGLDLKKSGDVGSSGGQRRGRAAASEDETDTDDEESDDGLVPYEMDDDEDHDERDRPGEAGSDEENDGGPVRIGEGRVPLPTSLRQCLSGLRSNNADDVEAAVFALPDLTAQSQDLSGEICCEVALTLLRLEDRIAMDDFVGRRHRGLVALACADPKQVALRFSKAVW